MRIRQLIFPLPLLAGLLWGANDPFVGKWKVIPSKSVLTDEMKVTSLGGNK